MTQLTNLTENHMAYEDCLTHVLDSVLGLDLPDEVLGQALADEAEMLSEQAYERD
ncbi:hypothetical protein [Ramlibacter albus]|uniref:Uncharacterized protein n=1 Tax=Ramlibacter albus TaxID=2079448 RepID=A0A923MFN7_9BURK|nr:hypothetical protein [Ramlibacter albus]MBC5768688.1 hypothetical protein [Ramlibacter albus]